MNSTIRKTGVKMIRTYGLVAFACLATVGTTACGQGANTSASDKMSQGNAIETENISVPTVQDKIDMLAEFRESSLPGCSKEFREGTYTEGEYNGATYQICRGNISSEEPYAIILITGGTSNYKDGSMIFLLAAHPHPLAYSELRDMIVRAAAVQDESEENEFNTALNRYMIAGANMPGSDVRPLFTSKAGIVTTIAPNAPQAGWLTVTLNP